jgi:hypothetical protein
MIKNLKKNSKDVNYLPRTFLNKYMIINYLIDLIPASFYLYHDRPTLITLPKKISKRQRTFLYSSSLTILKSSLSSSSVQASSPLVAWESAVAIVSRCWAADRRIRRQKIVTIFVEIEKLSRIE